MKNGDKIKKLCQQIVREFQPEKIILFGSHAYGKPDEDSDIDLLIVLPFEGRHTDQGVKIRQQIKSSVPMDLLIRTPDEIRKSLKLGDIFIKDIIENGKIVYESDYARVD
jgi:predicted nucleotidyltransferase